MAGTWSGLTHQPTFNTSSMLLLTDGRVMIQEEGTNHWHALTPDATGSYVNGSWSSLADMQYFRRYYASGVLKDGRVIVCGGEQNNVGTGDDTNNCQMYDPVTNTWSNIAPPPGWSQIGDATCCILPDGRLMIGALSSTACTIFDPLTNSWTNAANKAVKSNEETWILLPDNTILTAQCFSPYQSEKYNISTNSWKNEGAIPVSLVNHGMAEIGPAMLLYNGKVIYFGADGSSGHGKTALYTLPSSPTGTGTWTAGPDIPLVGTDVMVCNDCPATLLPNGKVLFAAAKYISNDWGNPIYFFEYDPIGNTIAQAPTPSNNGKQLFWSRLMLLPTGQVLFSPGSNNIQVYTPDSGPQIAWTPKTTSIKRHLNQPDYIVKGTQLNGLSQANIYGDDCYTATNYPLIRVRDNAGKVTYCKTNKFSTMGVATGANPHSFHFETKGLALGTYHLNVIANGIASADIAMKIVTNVIAERVGDFDGDGISEILVTSPWGIGILKQTGATMNAIMMAPNGTRFGGWLLNTGDNTIGEIADYDGDGHDEILITSPWGIGILKLSGGTLTAPMMAPNGTRFGGWLLSTIDNNFGPAADYDGDHHAELLVTSPWGIGILKLSGNTLTVPMMAPNGTRFGGWLINTGDNDLGPAADFDGDGHAEIFISSPWGIGILKLVGNTLTAPMMQPNGTRFGGWLLNTVDNNFGPAADYDGDGHAEIIVESPWGLGILKMAGNTMTAPMMQPNGTRFGGWLLNTADNAFGPAADFNGDGVPELFIRSPWGVGILRQAGNTMTVLMMAPNGTRFGGWLLNTADNSFGSAGKYGGGRIYDIFITSPWGIGILQLSGSTLNAPMMQPNGTRFGGWLLNTGDNVF